MSTYSREQIITNSILNIEINKDYKQKYKDIYQSYIPKPINELKLTPMETNLIKSIEKIFFKSPYKKLHPRLIHPTITSFRRTCNIKETIIWNSTNQGYFSQINLEYINMQRLIIIILFRCSPYIIKSYINKNSYIMPKGRYIDIEIIS